MSSELSVSPEDILKATEDYTRSSKVGPLFQDLALQTFKARPDEPSKFLLELLVRRHPDVAAELANKYIDKGKSEATQEEKKKLCVQITHEDLCTQQYLTEKVTRQKRKQCTKLAKLCRNLVDRSGVAAL